MFLNFMKFHKKVLIFVVMEWLIMTQSIFKGWIKEHLLVTKFKRKVRGWFVPSVGAGSGVNIAHEKWLSCLCNGSQVLE